MICAHTHPSHQDHHSHSLLGLELCHGGPLLLGNGLLALLLLLLGLALLELLLGLLLELLTLLLLVLGHGHALLREALVAEELRIHAGGRHLLEPLRLVDPIPVNLANL